MCQLLLFVIRYTHVVKVNVQFISFLCFLNELPDCEICQPELLLATYFLYTVRTVVARVQTTFKYVR